jgi:protein dithiol oxidoreductase (disulfide-forming)
MTARLFRVLAALLVCGWLAPAALAQPQQAPFLYIDPPIATDAAGKIEVVEFFWYECPHCFELEPLLEAWVPKLAKDVQFKRVPATFNDRWKISARVFYALESMGIEDKLHKPLMDAIHKDRLRITDERQLAEWLGKQKVDVAKFQAALKSFAVESRLKRAEELVLRSRIDGVPALMINGRYLVAAGGSLQRMIDTANALIEQSRKDMAAAPGTKAAAPAKK